MDKSGALWLSPASVSTRTDRVGESIVNNQGLRMTIVMYRSGKDIDVRFDDGTVVEHRQYVSFVRGKIAHPGHAMCTRRSDRVGLRAVNREGIDMEIIAYRSAVDVDVRFNDWRSTVVRHVSFRDFRTGGLRDPNHRSCYGVGYMGEGRYGSRNCRAYPVWTSMIRRCYDPGYHGYSAYGGRGVYVSDEWHCFQCFAEWYETRIVNGVSSLHMDKDLNGGTHYGPDVCVMIPWELNMAVQGGSKQHMDLPTGVYRSGDKFVAQLICDGERFYLGTYDILDEASAAYCLAKALHVEELAARLDDRLCDDGRRAVANYCARLRAMSRGSSAVLPVGVSFDACMAAQAAGR